MGLSASQARLLTITARKSDCEYQSMRYSHQKLSLSRNMTDISNEYQNALDATKLVYDFYGTGDKTNPLSYNLMMTPSELNGYLPLMLSDNSGKIILNAKYAAAAKAAGIPQEGLGCLPSSGTRDAFIQGMAASGLISQDAADLYTGIQYSQTIGNGSTDLATVTTEKMTLEEMLDLYTSGELCDVTTMAYSASDLKAEIIGQPSSNLSTDNFFDAVIRDGDNTGNYKGGTISLGDILADGKNYQILCRVQDNGDYMKYAATAISQLAIWEWLFGELANMLNVTGSPEVQSAITYAESMTSQLLDYSQGVYEYDNRMTKDGNGVDTNKWNGVINAMNGHTANRGSWDEAFSQKDASYCTSDYIGFTFFDNPKKDKTGNRNHCDDGVSISITNIAKAYLTYFAQAMEGLDDTKYSVSETTDNRKVKDSVLIDINDDQFLFDVAVSEGVNTDQSLNSGFYDAIFNQICMYGWRENINIDDSDYLQEMLKTGKLLLNSCSDDGYYYATNYATNTYIREISDEDMVAKAEAKYNTEKQKIENKEQILDLKMKNLDTEISSLTTEYDTIKSVISKNIEKSFKRYEA